MTKAELVAAMAERSGLDKKQAQKALDALLQCVTESVKGGQVVRIVGFGSFIPVDRPEGTARNPRTGAAVARPATKSVKFRVGEAFKNTLNGV